MISQDSRFDRSHHLIGVTGADAMKFTSRILEGLVVCRGLVEPREGIG
jgi:hypothetical protein